ncbi:DedA family protein [Patescibacteria group bacterium]|nr:DedA family protein [Patescibacteria group bacterium]
MTEIFDSLLEITRGLGHFGVFLLMAIESSFIPFPSEVVVLPAAYLASNGEMSVWLIVLAGVLGSLTGASLNYVLARYLGRSVVYGLAKKNFMKYLLVTHRKLEHAEEFFLKYGRISTFLGRLLPAIRQLISIPAGFSKMPFWSFILFTALGSGLWVIVLTFLGYYFGANQDLLAEHYRSLKFIFGGFVVLVVAVFLGLRYLRRDK